MKVVLLGTIGYHPSDRGQTLCLLIPECGVMLDAGTAVYRAAGYLRTSQLDVFLTHSHLDHVIGLTYLLDVVREHPLDRIRIHAQPATLKAVREHLFAEALFPVRPPFEFCHLAEEASVPGGGRLTHFPVEHPGGATGYRLDWPGHSMAYVTDTTAAPEADYVACIRGVDLLVHECYFSDAMSAWAKRTGHSCVSAVAQTARQAQVGRTVLVHLNPLSREGDPVGLDVARAIFPHTDLGRDLMEIEF